MGHKERYVGSLFRVDEPVPDDSYKVDGHVDFRHLKGHRLAGRRNCLYLISWGAWGDGIGSPEPYQC